MHSTCTGFLFIIVERLKSVYIRDEKSVDFVKSLAYNDIKAESISVDEYKEISWKMLVSNIPISQEFREDVRIMCNLSTGIEERATERATEKTSEKFILNMYKKGYTLDQIADVAETGVDEVEAIIKKKEPAMA